MSKTVLVLTGIWQGQHCILDSEDNGECIVINPLKPGEKPQIIAVNDLQEVEG